MILVRFLKWGAFWMAWPVLRWWFGWSHLPPNSWASFGQAWHHRSLIMEECKCDKNNYRKEKNVQAVIFRKTTPPKKKKHSTNGNPLHGSAPSPRGQHWWTELMTSHDKLCSGRVLHSFPVHHNPWLGGPSLDHEASLWSQGFQRWRDAPTKKKFGSQFFLLT